MPQMIGQAIAMVLGNLALAATASAGIAASATAFATATAIGMAVGQIVVGVGIPLLLGGVLGAKGNSQGTRPSDVQQEVQNEVGPRRVLIGTLRVIGARCFARTVPTDPDTVLLIWILGHGRIDSVLETRIDDNPVVMDGSDQVLTYPYAPASDEVHLVSYRLGANPETKYSPPLSLFGLDNMRGDGLASVLGRFNNFEDATAQLDVFPNGLPTIKSTVKGRVLFDPRQPTHDRTNETTWAYSDNPVVFLLNYMFVLPDGWGIPYERVAANIAEWSSAMDICDEQVTLAAGGTENRYRMAGSYYLTDDPVNITQKALAVCDGQVWAKRDGSVGIRVGEFVEPTVTIMSRDILAAEIVRGIDRLARIDGIVASYMSPAHGYVEQQAEPWPSAAAVVALGDERTATLDLTWAPSHGQTRRLEKRAYVKANPEWRGTITTNLAGLRALDERYIRLQMPVLGIDDTFEVGRLELDVSSMQVTMELSHVPSTIDDWDAATEEGTAPSVPSTEFIVHRNEGTKGGNFSVNPGSAFNGVTTENATNSAQRSGAVSSGYLYDSWNSPKKFVRAVFYPSSDGGFRSDGDGTVTLTVYGKNGSTPTAFNDGTLLATLSFGDSTAARTLNSIDTATAYDHWIYGFQITSGQLRVAEIERYENRPL